MKFENQNNKPTQKIYGDSEIAFNKLMAKAQDIEDVVFEEDEGVNLDSANKLISRLSSVMEEGGVCDPEDDESAREMIMTLEELQKQLPNEKAISAALVRLRQLRNKSLEETV